MLKNKLLSFALKIKDNIIIFKKNHPILFYEIIAATAVYILSSFYSPWKWGETNEVFNIVFSGVMEVAWIIADVGQFISENIQFDSGILIFVVAVFAWLTFFKNFLIKRFDLGFELGGFEGAASDYLFDIILSYVVALIAYKSVPVLMVFNDQGSDYYLLNLFHYFADNGSVFAFILAIIVLIAVFIFLIIPGFVSSLKLFLLVFAYKLFANIIEKVIHYPDSASFPMNIFAPVLLGIVTFLIGFILDTIASRFIEWVISLAKGLYSGRKENNLWHRFCGILEMMI